MAWNLLFTSDIGLLSLFTIAFIIVMAIFIGYYVVQHMKAEAGKAGSEVSPSPR